MKSSYSQLNEDTLLMKLFNVIGIKYNKSLEFGAGNGYVHSNTRLFEREYGWDSYFWDCNKIKNASPDVEIIDVNVKNINILFEYYQLQKLDLLSIDIDGNDYWIWKSLKYNPRVVIIEYNPNLKLTSKTIKYNLNHKFDKTIYYGASWNALIKLGVSKGYKFVDSTKLNMIFLLNTGTNDMNIIGNTEFMHSKPGWAPDKLNRKWITI